MQQAVARGLQLVADLRHVVLAGHGHQLQRIVPAAEPLGQRQARVRRHAVVEAIAGGPVFPVHPGQRALQREDPEPGLRQARLAGQVEAVQPRVLVHVLQHREGIAHRHAARGIGVGVPLDRVDVVGDRGHVGRGLQFPAAVGGVQVEGHRCSERALRRQRQVADVAIAVADEVVHDRGHGPGRPREDFVQPGRTHLAGEAVGDVHAIRDRLAQDRGGIPVAIRACPVRRVEQRRIAHLPGTHHVARGVVALHRAGIHPHALVAHAELRGPARVEVVFPLGVGRAAVALAVADVPERARPHHAARRRPPVVEPIGALLQSQSQAILPLQRDVCIQHEGSGVARGQHRHAGRAGRPDRRARGRLSAGRIVAARCRAVPEPLVRAEIHRVVQGLAIRPCLQLSPA